MWGGHFGVVTGMSKYACVIMHRLYVAKDQEVNSKLGLHSDESNNLVQNCAEKFPVHVAIQDQHLKQIQ